MLLEAHLFIPEIGQLMFISTLSWVHSDIKETCSNWLEVGAGLSQTAFKAEETTFKMFAVKTKACTTGNYNPV